MQKRRSSAMSEDSNSFSLFGSFRKLRTLRPGIASRNVSSDNSGLSERTPLAARVSSAISGKLPFRSYLNPPKSDVTRETSVGARSQSSLFEPSSSFNTQGFAIVGSKTVGIRAPQPKSKALELKQMLLKKALLQQYKDELAGRRKILGKQLDAEEAEEEANLKSGLAPLSQEAVSRLLRYFAAAAQVPTQTVVDAFRIELSFSDLATLRPGKWLNDNVIDMYLASLTANDPEGLFAFTTHFFTKLDSEGYGAVKRWAIRKKLNVFKPRFVFIPVNRDNVHWTLAVVNNRDKRLEFYDSLPSGRGQHELSVIKGYLENEAKRLGEQMPEYAMVPFCDGPRQTNGYDCGVFVCENVRRIALDQGLKYGQNNMKDIRLHMANALLELGSKAKL